MGSSPDNTATRCTLQTFGTFSTPTFGGVGEPYDDTKKMSDSRAKGNQFTTNKQRGGQTGDNWNRNSGRRNDVKRLYEGEVYVDPHTYERKWKMEQKKKNLTPDGFKYSSPNSKSSGLGGTWGMIGPKLAHEPEFEVVKKGEVPGEVKHELRQVVTSPAKKGYGANTPGTMFGPGPRKGEKPTIGKEYEHSPDPYDLARQFEREERKFNQEKLAGRQPYRTMGHSVDFFDGHKSVAAPKGLAEDPRMPDKPEPASPEVVPTVPFYPSRAPRSGPMGTFQKFPEYIEDPLEEKIKAARAVAAATRITTTAFRPTSNAKSTPQKTILFHEAGVHM